MTGAKFGTKGCKAGGGAVLPSRETVKFKKLGNRTPPIVIPDPDAEVF
jgi:hypothetical protein